METRLPSKKIYLPSAISVRPSSKPRSIPMACATPRDRCYKGFFIKLQRFCEHKPKTKEMLDWLIKEGFPLVASASELEDHFHKNKGSLTKFMQAALTTPIYLCISEATLLNNLQCHLRFPPTGKLQANVDASLPEKTTEAPNKTIEAHIASVLIDENGTFVDVKTAIINVNGSVEGELRAIEFGSHHVKEYSKESGNVVASDCEICTKWVNEGTEPARYLSNYENQVALVRTITNLLNVEKLRLIFTFGEWNGAADRASKLKGWSKEVIAEKVMARIEFDLAKQDAKLRASQNKKNLI